MSSKYNLTTIKGRRCYTPEEIAELCGVNRKTISRWLQTGLKPIQPDTRPLLIRGVELRRFLTNERERKKQPLRYPNEFFCLRCRTRVLAPEASVEVKETGKRIGKENRKQERKIGTCPHCSKPVSKYL